LRNLLQGFLHFIFAKVELAGIGCGSNGIDGMGFGDGDQANIAATAASAVSRVRNSLANGG
jgi:hypothetical protein